jgi:hypothetical protein
MAQSAVAPPVKSNARQFKASEVFGGSCDARTDCNNARLQVASSVPSTPPAAENRRLSVMSWRMILTRVAPSDSRTAISFRRFSNRLSNSDATFAQAISSRHPAAPSSMYIVGATPLTRVATKKRGSLMLLASMLVGCRPL